MHHGIYCSNTLIFLVELGENEKSQPCYWLENNVVREETRTERSAKIRHVQSFKRHQRSPPVLILSEIALYFIDLNFH